MFKTHSHRTMDMTEGPILTKVLFFSLPIMLSGILQLLFNAADTIVVGRFAGRQALAAVGSVGSLNNMIISLFVGLSIGVNVLVARYTGAKDNERVSETVHTAVLLSVVGGSILTIIGLIAARPLLEIMGSPEDVIDLAELYTRIIFVGMPVQMLYNFSAAILRAVGDTKRPLYFLTIAGVINAGLNLVFVIAFKMSVAGVALATIISQAVSGILCLVRLLLMRDVLHITWRTLWPTKALLFQLIRLGLPSGLTQAVFSLAMLVVQSLTNSFGTTIIAVSTVVMRVDGFAMMPNFTFGTATTTFTGQNIGAGRLDRVEKGTKDGLKLGLSVSVVLVALILFFGRYLMEMFTSTPEVIDTGMHMMRILAIGYIAMAVTQILSGVMRGAGDTMTPMWISLITTVVIRVPIAYGLAALMHSADALFISLLTSWVMGAVLTSIAFRMGRWKKKSIINDDVPEPADVQV